VISPDLGGRGAWAWRVENYTGYQAISGIELMRKFEDHMRQFDVRHWPDEVSRVEPFDSGFTIYTSDGRDINTKAVLIASGRKSKELQVPGADHLRGHGIAYCATCDAPLFRDEDVAVIGGGNAAIYSAMQLADLAHKVYLISNTSLTAERAPTERLRKRPNVEIKEACETLQIKGEDMVTGIEIRPVSDHRVVDLPVAGVFVEIGTEPNAGYIKNLVDLDAQGQVIVDCLGRTSRPGVFAAGDVTNTPEKQIIISAGEGARAALTAYRYLSAMRT
jgi:alkyl hydroperoxide reductase subunit F